MNFFIISSILISCFLIFQGFNTAEVSVESDKKEIEEFVKYIAKKPAVAAIVSSKASRDLNHAQANKPIPDDSQIIGENNAPNEMLQIENDQDSMINNDPREEYDSEGNPVERIPSSAFEDIVIDD
jgi:hypothetical protein